MRSHVQPGQSHGYRNSTILLVCHRTSNNKVMMMMIVMMMLIDDDDDDDDDDVMMMMMILMMMLWRILQCWMCGMDCDRHQHEAGRLPSSEAFFPNSPPARR